MPEVYQVTIRGVTPLLFNRWQEGNPHTLDGAVHRDQRGFMGIPSTFLHSALYNAGRFKKDPRSPRKSAMALVKAGVIVQPEIATFKTKKGGGVKVWDYVDERRILVGCCVQRRDRKNK